MTALSRREFTASIIGAAAVGAKVDARVQSSPPRSGAITADALASLTLSEAAERIRTRAVNSTELVHACLSRIKIYNPKLNAFITVSGDAALAKATALDAEQRAGKLRGSLHGIPVALKDNIDTSGLRTTAGSAVFDDRLPEHDAEVTRRLEAAGAIVIGKANLHEFAMGGTSATSYYGPVRNPWALERNPGGSSGGSAAAIAANLCFGALGTDTGGSIRTPASYCGVIGLKPTYGLVSIRGIIPLTLSLDHCGPLTRTVRDAALMLNVLAGYDRLDIASVEHPTEDYVAALDAPVSGFRLGIARGSFFDHLDADVARAIEDAFAVLRKLTRSMADTVLPPTSGIALRGESNAYHDEFIARMPDRYMIPTRRSLQNGATAKASDYVRSRWKLDLLRRTIDDAFREVDLVVLPTRRRTPRTVDAAIKREEGDVPLNPELENTGAFNMYGIPAISVPCGFTAAGLPVGLMIAGPRFSESKVLALAHAFERATEWHLRQPDLRPDTPVPPLAPTDERREDDF